MSAVLSTTTTSIETVADREGSPLSETNTTKGPDFSATGSDPEEVVSFGLREVIRKQRIVSRVCVYSPDLCHKVSRLSRIGDALTVNGAIKITDTDTMAIRYRFKSEKLSSFMGTCLN
ncbi:hypothetical protein F7725_010119 [Dissostichus mawsoni]|uniref:Uncharacterized protein n=1 Tax=Dissostichus mawsoni TaxID=36200 RepID=A0A7J5XN22_DISMA|nr:hypothetical protein F7725_010119 [Dissostichus mawsoni]